MFDLTDNIEHGCLRNRFGHYAVKLCLVFIGPERQTGYSADKVVSLIDGIYESFSFELTLRRFEDCAASARDIREYPVHLFSVKSIVKNRIFRQKVHGRGVYHI